MRQDFRTGFTTGFNYLGNIANVPLQASMEKIIRFNRHIFELLEKNPDIVAFNEYLKYILSLSLKLAYLPVAIGITLAGASAYCVIRAMSLTASLVIGAVNGLIHAANRAINRVTRTPLGNDETREVIENFKRAVEINIDFKSPIHQLALISLVKEITLSYGARKHLKQSRSSKVLFNTLTNASQLFTSNIYTAQGADISIACNTLMSQIMVYHNNPKNNGKALHHSIGRGIENLFNIAKNISTKPSYEGQSFQMR